MSTRTDPWPRRDALLGRPLRSGRPGRRRFYAAVIGWTFVDSGPDYGGYQIGQMDGRAAAGIGPVMQEGQPSAWTVTWPATTPTPRPR